MFSWTVCLIICMTPYNEARFLYCQTLQRGVCGTCGPWIGCSRRLSVWDSVLDALSPLLDSFLSLQTLSMSSAVATPTTFFRSHTTRWAVLKALMKVYDILMMMIYCQYYICRISCSALPPHQLEKLQKAASAAQTYFVANPSHLEMRNNIEKYRRMQGVTDDDFQDRELENEKHWVRSGMGGLMGLKRRR